MCQICGKNSCTESFHPIDEQEHFNSVASRVKELIHKRLWNKAFQENGSTEIIVKWSDIETILE